MYEWHICVHNIHCCWPNPYLLPSELCSLVTDSADIQTSTPGGRWQLCWQQLMVLLHWSFVCVFLYACVQEKQLRSIRDTSSHKAVTLMHCSWLTDSALKLLRSSVGSNSFINVQNKSGTNFRTFTAGCWKKTYKCKKVYQAADNFEILVFSFSQT